MGATTIATVTGLVGLRMAEAQQRRRCDEEASAIAAVWNDDRRAETREAIVASNMSYAEPLARSLEESLDDLTNRWKLVRRSVCVARSVDESMEPSVSARAEDCLAADLAKIDGMLERLAGSEPHVVSRVGFAAATFEGPERCERDAWLAHVPASTEALANLGKALAGAQVSLELDDWADAEQRAQELMVLAQRGRRSGIRGVGPGDSRRNAHAPRTPRRCSRSRSRSAHARSEDRGVSHRVQSGVESRDQRGSGAP